MQIEILVLVKSYPTPSRSLKEAVCVLGVSLEMGLVRIYLIPYRQLEDEQQFSKYQVLRMKVRKPRQDPRPNTFRPDLDTIEVVGKPISSRHKWRQRREWIQPFLSESMCQIQKIQRSTRLSMGIFKPKEVLDLVQENAEKQEWSRRDLAKLKRKDLFLTKENKLLERIPYNWKYVYRCADPACKKPHRQTIIDWEIHQLYRNLRRKGISDPEEIHRQIRRKFLDELCGSSRDTYFITGNMVKHPRTFLILGVFWPPKDPQGRLF